MTSNALTVEVTIAESIESDDDEVPDPTRLRQWASAAYLLDEPAIVSLYIATGSEITELNSRYRDKDAATNVLSFPMSSPGDLPADIPADDQQRLLGDIALCAEVINAEACQQHKTAEAHWAHMVVHGMLHLQDYDHLTDADASEMEHLETGILGDLGFDDPYTAGVQ